MKILVKRLPYALLVAMFLFLLDSEIFAQTTDQITYCDQTCIDDKALSYNLYLEQYYKDKTPKEMWRDYVDLRLKQDGSLSYLLFRAHSFKEPFKSWAVNEIHRIDLNDFQLSDFLSLDFPEKAKSFALKRFLDSQLSDTTLKVSAPYLENIIVLVHKINEKSDSFSSYRVYLIDLILNDPNIIYVSNERLISILYWCSSSQKTKVAERILYNNPQRPELKIIAKADIKGYSDVASSMFFQEELSTSNTDPNWDFDTAKRHFLAGKMDQPEAPSLILPPP